MTTPERRGRPREPVVAYQTLLRAYNKSTITEGRKAERFECICGKTIYKSQIERHLITDAHKRLMKYKTLSDEHQNLINPPHDINVELDPEIVIQRVMRDITFRNQLKSIIELLSK
jgi:hypothetical protein